MKRGVEPRRGRAEREGDDVEGERHGPPVYPDAVVELLLSSSVVHSALLFLPIAIALLLRAARCPGWSALGGAVAGMILGPAILGRVAPIEYERFLLGGTEERIELDALDRRHAADRLAFEAAGGGSAAWTALERSQARDRAVALAELDAARWKFQRPTRSYSAAMAALALLAAGLLRRRPAERQPPGHAISIGLGSAIIPAALAGAWIRLVGGDLDAQLMAAAAVAIGPWRIAGDDREAADRAETGGAHLVRNAGRCASIIGLLLLVLAAHRSRGGVGVGWVAPLLALPLGWALPPLAEGPTRRAVAAIAQVALVPVLAAVVAVRIEFLAGFSIAALAVFVLLSADARWFGALLGALLPGGRRPLRTMRLVLGSMACGPTQLAVVATAIGLGGLDEATAFALLVGAVLLEVTAGARRRMAEQLIGTEEELARLRDDEG